MKIDRKCDFCDKKAVYDGKTKSGPWAYMCNNCFKIRGINTKGLFTVINEEVLKSEVSNG